MKKKPKKASKDDIISALKQANRERGETIDKLASKGTDLQPLQAEIVRLNQARNEMITEIQSIKEINRYLVNENRCLTRKIKELK